MVYTLSWVARELQSCDRVDIIWDIRKYQGIYAGEVRERNLQSNQPPVARYNRNNSLNSLRLSYFQLIFHTRLPF